MLRLVRELKQQSISKGTEDNSSGDEGSARPIETHRSAKVNSKRDKEHLRDSGTESDEEELEEIALKSMASVKNYEDFLSGGSPPAIFSSPPLASEIDTESWDSFGRESGILTGDGDSDSDDCATPRPRRRLRGGAFIDVAVTKEQCEFPPMNMNSGAEKRRHSMTGTKPNFEDAPISSRLRSNNECSREIIIAARRAPVRLLINKPYAQASCKDDILSSSPPISYPAVKRHRRDSWRPSLNFDKMIKNRIAEDVNVPSVFSPVVSSTKDHAFSSQD